MSWRCTRRCSAPAVTRSSNARPNRPTRSRPTARSVRFGLAASGCGMRGRAPGVCRPDRTLRNSEDRDCEMLAVRVPAAEAIGSHLSDVSIHLHVRSEEIQAARCHRWEVPVVHPGGESERDHVLHRESAVRRRLSQTEVCLGGTVAIPHGVVCARRDHDMGRWRCDDRGGAIARAGGLRPDDSDFQRPLR